MGNFIKRENIDRVTEQLKESIFNKIPVLSGQQEVYLPKIYFKKLTDEEFIVLWNLPLRIKCSPETGKYIEERRRVLGLKREDGKEVIDESK